MATAARTLDSRANTLLPLPDIGLKSEDHGGCRMSGRSRSVLLASLVPAVLLGGIFAVAQAQNAGAPAAKATQWSDPATWPNQKVPVAGDKVTIGKDKDVILDVSPPALGGLSIDGKLTFADNADLELTTEWVMVHGERAIGAEALYPARCLLVSFLTQSR